MEHGALGICKSPVCLIVYTVCSVPFFLLVSERSGRSCYRNCFAPSSPGNTPMFFGCADTERKLRCIQCRNRISSFCSFIRIVCKDLHQSRLDAGHVVCAAALPATSRERALGRRQPTTPADHRTPGNIQGNRPPGINFRAEFSPSRGGYTQRK